jgi:hypothetical protein
VTNDSKIEWSVEIAPAARPWYDRETVASAVEQAKETIEEWSYEEDPHGYCHERPMLVRLVEAVERGVEWGGQG